MTQEEKAKAYDEALEKAREIKEKIVCSHLSADSCKAVAEYIDTIIPELAESEDERIRNDIMEAVENWLPYERVEEIRAYLNEQKEQKPVDADYISGIREELLGIEDNAKTIVGLTESQWVAIRAAHRLLGEYIEKDQKPHLTVNGKGFYKICPHCKSRMIRDDSKVYTSMPPQYGYNCPKCGAMEFDTVMYDNPEMEEQKPDVDKYMEGYAKGFKDAEALYNNGVAFHIDNPCICKLEPNVVIESKTNGTDNVVIEQKSAEMPTQLPWCDNLEEKRHE